MLFDWIFNIDVAILNLIQQFLRTPFGDWFMVLCSTLGDGGFIWIVIAVFMLCRKSSRKYGWIVLVSMLLGVLLNDVLLKNLVERIRPCNEFLDVEMLIVRPQSYSFMSGHTLSSFAAATSVFLYDKKWGMAAGVLAALIAFSRLYVFVHYPSDVLAGCVCGILLALAVKKAFDAMGSSAKRRRGHRGKGGEKQKRGAV